MIDISIHSTAFLAPRKFIFIPAQLTEPIPYKKNHLNIKIKWLFSLFFY